MEAFPGIRAEELLAQLDWLTALARHLARDQELADDVSQDACLIALQQRPADPSKLRSWLAQVVRNLLRQRVRDEDSRRLREQARVDASVSESAYALVERIALQRELASLVLDLEEPYRSTVVLRFYAGLPLREIARLHGSSVTVVHERLRKALTRVRRRLDRSAGGTAVWTAVLIGDRVPIGTAVSTNIGALLVNTKFVLAAGCLVAGALVTVLVLRQSTPADLHEPVNAAPSIPDVDRFADPHEASASEIASREAISVETAESAMSSVSDEQQATDLEKARDRMRGAIEASLHGDLDAGALLDLGLALVELEPGPAIPEPGPSGRTRFPLQGTPDGLTANLEVGRTSHGEATVSLRICLDAPGEPYLVEGIERAAPELELGTRKDEDGKLKSMSFLTVLQSHDREALRNGQVKIPEGLHYFFRREDPYNPSVRMSFLEGMEPNFRPVDADIDSWRITGGPWPRLEDMELFHQKLQAMYASLKK
jgi:RNA polymerase sigma factor (sigma-70 family)